MQAGVYSRGCKQHGWHPVIHNVTNMCDMCLQLPEQTLVGAEQAAPPVAHALAAGMPLLFLCPITHVSCWASYTVDVGL
jgi:hypothetical protein